jgi:hypothetical protein
MSAPDVTQAIYDVLLASSNITSLLPAYRNSFPIFTRRPIPADSPYPCIVISQDITLTDEDGINDYRPRILRDVVAYNLNDTPARTRAIHTLGFALWYVFSRPDVNLAVGGGWSIADLTVMRAVEVIADDRTVGRAVQLSILAAKKD